MFIRLFATQPTPLRVTSAFACRGSVIPLGLEAGGVKRMRQQVPLAVGHVAIAAASQDPRTI
jgi:hypothetical protein